MQVPRVGLSILCLTLCSAALGSRAAAQPAGAQAGAAAPTSAVEQVQLSLMTFGRGDQVHQYFGHNALLVQGAQPNDVSVVNYGMFAFGPGMIPNFIQGRLSFWVGQTDYARTLAAYQRMNRDVRVSDLNLDTAQRAQVLRELQHDLAPENRVYLYDHYFNNCSTRLRDIVDRAVHGELKRAWSKPAPYTLRGLTQRYTNRDPWTEWIMLFVLNDKVDRPLTLWGQAFLPEEFEQQLDRVTYTDSHGARVPLVQRKRMLFQAQRGSLPPRPVAHWPHCLALGSVVGGVGLLLAELWRSRQRTLYRIALAIWVGTAGVVSGILGTMLCFVWAFTDHVVTYHNENLFLTNPLNLLGGIAGWLLLARPARAVRLLYWCWPVLAASSVLLGLLKLSSANFDQLLGLSAPIFAPLDIGFGLASYRLRTAAATLATEPPRNQAPAVVRVDPRKPRRARRAGH